MVSIIENCFSVENTPFCYAGDILHGGSIYWIGFVLSISAACFWVIQTEGLVKYFQQFHILFGHHHAVTADGIEQYA